RTHRGNILRRSSRSGAPRIDLSCSARGSRLCSLTARLCEHVLSYGCLAAPYLCRSSDIDESSAESEVALVALRTACPAHLADARQEVGQAICHVDTRVVPCLQMWPVSNWSAEQSNLRPGAPERIPEDKCFAGCGLLWIELVQPPVFVLDHG